MTTIKVKFRASSVMSKEGSLFFQVFHNRFVRQINTGCKLYPFEWDKKHSIIIFSENIKDERYRYLVSVKEQINKKLQCLRVIISDFETNSLNFTADEIVRMYHNQYGNGLHENGFLGFIRKRIMHFRKIGKISASEKLQSALNSFILFYERDEISFYEINCGMMEEYEGFLRKRGLCKNSISFYMRILRSVYNASVECGLTVQRHPFKTVYTGIDKTVKRAVPLNVIRKIRDLDLASSPTMELARDLFMFSFYTRGMSFVDMAFLKKKDLQNGVLVYRRNKTNQQLMVKWEKPMQDIIDKYDTGTSPFLLPIIKDLNSDLRRQYKNAVHLVNKKLKLIGEKIGLNIPLTTYVARHGWASIAKYQNIPIATISEALGHESEKTTRIYLASLDTSAVDNANSQILNLL